VWFDVPLHIKTGLVSEGYDIGACIHSLNHAAVLFSPLLANCDPSDIATEHDLSLIPHHTLSRVIIFDRQTGGTGVADTLFMQRDYWLSELLQFIKSCPCERGCPKCVLDSRCSAYNNNITKKGCLLLLSMLMERMSICIDHDSVSCSNHNSNSSRNSIYSIPANDIASLAAAPTTTPTTPIQNTTATRINKKEIENEEKEKEEKEGNDVMNNSLTPRQQLRNKSLKKARMKNGDAGIRAAQMAIRMDWSCKDSTL
jgi:hypothetical protein